MKTYRQLAELLADAGVSSVFGVMGDGNMHWLAAYRALAGCTFHAAWHEAGAVWMADGYAVASGHVGVATVTMGPGLAQSLAALTTAVRTRRPVLLITADLPSTDPPQAQEAPQEQWVTACGARYFAVHTAAELPEALGSALASASRGDVSVLAVDVEVFGTTASPMAAPRAASTPVPVPVPDLTDAVRVLASARDPLVIIGHGVHAADCLAEVLDLGRRWGAAFATTLGGRSALPEEPFDLGVIGMMAHPVARAVASSADVVLVLGCSLDRYNTDGATLWRDAAVVRMDLRPPDTLWSPSRRTTDCTGDLATIVPALATRLSGGDSGVRTEGLRIALAGEREREDALGARSMPDGANPWAMVAELDTALPSDALVVIGIGHFWYFAAPYLRPAPRRRMHFTNGFALIGQAVPTAIGAALALREQSDPRPVVAVEGDGSLPMNVQELQAAVRHGADLLLVVLDNAAYGSEYHKLVLADLDVASSVFDERPFPVCAVAEAMGATVRQADDPAQLRSALAELLPLRGVRVVDARIARSPMSEVYERQHGRARDESSH